MERKIEPFELRSWVNEIYKYPAFFDSLSAYQKQVFQDFVKREITKELLDLNDWYLANPLEKIEFLYLNELKKVRQIIESLKDDKAKETITLQSNERIEAKQESEIIEIKPVLKPESVQTVFDVIKDFFSPEQQTKLKKLIESGIEPSEKLLFKDNGNRLTDTFKKLFEHYFIIGCLKRDLESWIFNNFQYLKASKPTDYKPEVLNKYISGNNLPCKRPLIEIKKGQIHKVEQPRTKKYNKY